MPVFIFLRNSPRREKLAVYYKTYMKRFLTGGYLSLVILSVLAGSLLWFLNTSAAGAAQYTLYYPDENKKDLKPIFEDGEKQEEIGDKMLIVAKGGLFGDGYNLSFSPSINQQMNKKNFSLSSLPGLSGTPFNTDPTFGDDDSDEYYAVAPAYCQNNTVSLEQPSTRPYYEIDYVLAYKFSDWNAVTSGTTYTTYAGITKVVKINEGADNETLHLKTKKTGPNNIGDNDTNDGYGKTLSEALPEQCRQPFPRGNLGSKTQNYWKLSEEDRKAIDEIVESGTGASIDSGTASTGVNCAGGPMGWLFCPLVNAMAKTVQVAGGLIDDLMQVRFLASANSASEIEKAWRAILSLANLLLVVAFLFIIFSQATSMGLSNYNIKRMLPRLVIAAILMNVSFYICALAIDASNIVGASTMGFLIGPDNSIETSLNNATGGGGDFISGAITGIAIIALAFFIFVPVVLSIVLVFIVLIARQVILMVLVLLSPLAFVAWLLPNTEKYFKKWYEIFFQMLVLYPMVMFMFGASLYLANLIGNDNINVITVENRSQSGSEGN